MPSPADWTIAVDQLLCERRTPCVLCQSPRVVRIESHPVRAGVATICLCRACAERDPQRTALTTLLAKRYRGGW